MPPKAARPSYHWKLGMSHRPGRKSETPDSRDQFGCPIGTSIFLGDTEAKFGNWDEAGFNWFHLT